MIRGVNKNLQYNEANGSHPFRLAIGVDNIPLIQESTCKDYLQDFLYSTKFDRKYEIYGFKAETVTPEYRKMFLESNTFQLFVIENNSSQSYKVNRRELQEIGENIIKGLEKFENVNNIENKVTLEFNTFISEKHPQANCMIVTLDKWYVQKSYRLSFIALMVREIKDNITDTFYRVYPFLGNNSVDIKKLFEEFINGKELEEQPVDEKTDPSIIHNRTGIKSTLESNTSKIK